MPIQPVQKKSHKKAIIITLVILFVIMPMVTVVAGVLLLPSMRMCAGIAQTGQDVAAVFKDDLTLTSYNYSCLSETPPNADSQQVNLDYVTSTKFDSKQAVWDLVSGQLVDDGWTLGAVGTTGMAGLAKGDYITNIDVFSYQPARVILRVNTAKPDVNFGFVFGRDPVAQKTLTAADKQTYVTAPVYTPEFIPSGYSAWTVQDISNNGYITVNLNNASGKAAPRLVFTTPVPEGYDIAADCNVDSMRRGAEAECVLLAETPGGIKIYSEKTISRFNGFKLAAIVNGTLVTLENGYKSPEASPQLTTTDAVQVYDSLKQVNTPAK